MNKNTKKYITFNKHLNSDCDHDLKESWNKANGIYIECPKCGYIISKICTSPQKPQFFINFVDETNKIECKDGKLLQVKYEKCHQALVQIKDVIIKDLKKGDQMEFSGYDPKFYKKMAECQDEDVRYDYDHIYDHIQQYIIIYNHI